tara:strand:+ start:6326 stop:6583 length:258 start_codon:yes stop_codon:yes gene_type:complete
VSQVVVRAVKTSLSEAARVWKVPKMTVAGWVEAYADGRLKIDEHLHHWDLASPNGPVTTGVCRACQEERKFRISDNFRGWKPNSK